MVHDRLNLNSLNMKKAVRQLAWTIAPVALIVFGACQSGGTEQGNPYQGKTLRIVTSNSPGGGFDFYMRLTAKYVGEVGNIRVAAQNIEGAGGTLGDNKLYHSRADGLTIGLINSPGHILAQLLRHPGVRYDFRKWEWLGRVAGIPPAVAVTSNSAYGSIDDLIQTDRTVRFGLEGRGSDAYYGTVFLSNVLDIPIQQIVGYSGPGEMAGAMLAGEIDARFESIDTLLPQVKQGDLRLLLIFDSQPDSRFPEVSTIPDLEVAEETREKLLAWAALYQLERSFVAPPGTPEKRVDYLRKLLWQAWNTEGFQRELEAAGRGWQLMSGPDLKKEAAKVAERLEVLTQLLEESPSD